MARTAAERSAAYRAKKRDEIYAPSVTERDENVTVKRDVTECDGPSVTGADLHEVGSAAELMEDLNAPGFTEQATPNNLIERCVKRAAAGKPHRDGDPAWPYTRHLIPSDFAAWCKVHKPRWLTSAKTGDADYNWDESAVPRDNPAYGKVTV